MKAAADSHYEAGAVWEGRYNPEEQLRVVEDRGELVLVERFGRVGRGQHHRPFLVPRNSMELYATPTARVRGPVS